jgi:hypothetical protein
MPEYEYAFLWVGGESGRPWGTKAQGYVQSPQLNRPSGVTVPVVTIAAGDETGNGKTLGVSVGLEVGKWVGAELRLGSPTSPLGGVFEITQNATLTVTGNWTTAAAADGTFAGFIVFKDREDYEEVRVLVPYQPEGDTTNTVPYPADPPAANSLPPFDHLGNALILPTSVTTHEDWGLFLPFTFKEGVASFGISDDDDSRSSSEPHACTAVTATTFDFVNSGVAIPAGTLDGGYIRVTHDTGVSWSRIGAQDSNTPNAQLTGLSWLGAGLPTGTPGTFIYEAWAPHYDTSPYAYLPGPGFRYPNHDMMPSYEGNGRILNLPKAHSTASYGDRYGAMLEFGYRMSSALGKRINMVHLSVNDTTLIPRTTPNTDCFRGTLGWWDSRLMSDWSTAKTGGLADRFKKMVDTIAPNALLAEGSTKLLRILGIVLYMGEEDTTVAAGRESYSRSMPDFLEWLRDVVDDAGLNPYEAGVSIPVVHPKLNEDPWESTANDEDGLVNAATLEIMEADGYGATIDQEGSTVNFFDTAHFTGVGEGLNGNLISLAMQPLVNRALAFGSEIVEDTRQREIDICCRALSLIGEKEITSLDVTVDTSRRAKLCDKYYAQARDRLLTGRAWGFAMRRRMLVSTAAAPPPSWLFSYVVPPYALKVVSVMPEGATNDNLDDYPFEVEQAPGGHRTVYSDVEDAEMRYVTQLTDATRYSETFAKALSYELASLLAGPFLKGREGARVAREMTAQAEFHSAQASDDDASQRMSRIDWEASWVDER